MSFQGKQKVLDGKQATKSARKPETQAHRRRTAGPKSCPGAEDSRPSLQRPVSQTLESFDSPFRLSTILVSLIHRFLDGVPLRHDGWQKALDFRQTACGVHNNGKPSSGKVLLVTKVLIRSNENVKGPLGGREQLAVVKLRQARRARAIRTG